MALTAVGKWSVDLTTQKTNWSDDLYEILQIEPGSEVTMVLYRECMEPSAAEQLDARLQRAVVNKEDFTLDHQAVCRKGHDKYLRLYGTVEFDAADKPVRLYGTVQDITAFQKAEQEREQLALVAAKTSEAVIILTPENKIDWVNHSFTRITGYQYEEAREQNPFELLLGDITDTAIQGEIETGIQTRNSFEHEVQYIDKFGKPFWAKMSFAPNLDHNAKLKSYILICSDITLRKRQEQELQEKNDDILASIRYAMRIQHAILPEQTLLENYFNGHLIFYKPKDIVSGDFYWFTEKKDSIYVLAADCTGHGVPGAFMSVLGNTAFNEAIQLHTDPASILGEVDLRIQKALQQKGDGLQLQDGMDLGLLCYSKQTETVQYAGANRPLVLIRKGEVEEIAYDRQPIGHSIIHGIGTAKTFTNQEVAVQAGDRFYLFSDGITDQFSPNRKKWGRSKLKEMLLSTATSAMTVQLSSVEAAYEEWRGDTPQTDDIVLIGVEV